MSHLWSGRAATEMARYFIGGGNLGAFVSAHSHLNLTERDAVLLAQRLVQENVIELCCAWDSGPGLGAAYQTYNLPPDDEIDYGVLECLVHGFPFIRHHFQGAVVPLVQRSTSKPDGEIGSAFLIENGEILTARHCIVGHAPNEASSVELIGINPQTIQRILIPKDSRRDMAVAICRKPIDCGRNGLRLGTGFVPDEVMALGYPPIPGYSNVLSALRARVAGDLSEYLRSTTGEVAAAEKPYLTPIRTHLLSARVKGGSSGGPALSKRGEVIGMITASPSSDSEEVDRLGFGTAIASSEIVEFLSEIANQTDRVGQVNFQVEEGALKLELGGWWRV
jgi:serine protease Do